MISPLYWPLSVCHVWSVLQLSNAGGVHCVNVEARNLATLVGQITSHLHSQMWLEERENVNWLLGNLSIIRALDRPRTHLMLHAINKWFSHFGIHSQLYLYNISWRILLLCYFASPQSEVVIVKPSDNKHNKYPSQHVRKTFSSKHPGADCEWHLLFMHSVGATHQ